MTEINIISESAVAVTFGDSIDLKTHRKVLNFSDLLPENPFPGLLDVVPAYASVTVFFDPVLVKENRPEQTSPACAVRDFLKKKLLQFSTDQSPVTNQPVTNQPITIKIPVRYDGPDLAAVAERLNLSANEVIAIHSAAAYTVFMIGFMPGFPYLGPLPETLQLPRRDTPRLRVPAGSVAIAGAQTGIYPINSPGGWHLIGRTDFQLFDPLCYPPALLQAGKRVKFIPV